MSTQVTMPQLGESVVEGTVTKWLRQEGETIQELEALLEVNTDKVDTEIPSPASGTLLKIVVPEGTTVNAGTVLAWIGQPGELPDEDATAMAGSSPAPAAVGAAQAAPEAVQPQAGQKRELGFISPVVARLAREHNLDLALVKGSGEGGRITKRDVLAYLEESPAPTGPVKPLAPAPAASPTEIWETPADRGPVPANRADVRGAAPRRAGSCSGEPASPACGPGRASQAGSPGCADHTGCA